jgi:GMP synthase (glutamine-hydrolysing)
MVLPLAVWTTGSPVAAAEESHGDFFKMITKGVGDYPGGFIDVRSIYEQPADEPAYPDPTSVSGIIVSGSPARLPDQEAWMLSTERALVQAYEAGVPILGLCFGHQLLGEALGGKVAPNPRGREIGTVALQKVADDPLLDGIGAEPTIVMTHLDSVVAIPEGTTIVRTTSLEAHAALRFNEVTWGVQFHPEMNAEIIGHYLEARRDQIEAEGIDVDALLAARKDSAFGAQLLAHFGHFCASRAPGASNA